MRTTVIKSVAPVVGLLLGSSQALDVYPAACDAWPTSLALAAGVAHAKLVPFGVDYTAQPNYQTDKVLGQYSSAVWDAGVAIYDSDTAFGSLPLLTWQVSKGPGRPNNTLTNP